MEKTAKILSRVFSPLIVPSIAIAIALWGTPLVITPDFVKVKVVAMTLLITGAIPAIGIAILYHLHRVSDTTISNPKERTIPFVICVICYMGEAYYLMSIHAPIWLCNFILSAMMAIIIVMAINVFWKISGHTCALGGLVGLSVWLVANNLALPWMILVVIFAIILTGIVGSARMIRRLHDLPQVVAGAIIGFLAVYFLPNLFTRFIEYS